MVKGKQDFVSIGKTELVLSTSPKKKLVSVLRTKFDGKGSRKQFQSNISKFKFKNLTCKQQISHVTIKLNKSTAKLSKLRHILDKKLWSLSTMQFLKSIYAMLQLSGLKALVQSLSPLIRLPLRTTFLLANL